MSERGKDIAAIGNDDFVLGFRLAGVKRSVGVAGEAEFETELAKALDDKSLGIVVVQAADVERSSPSLKRRVGASVDPVVVALGGEGGGDLREKIKRAIGIDLYKD